MRDLKGPPGAPVLFLLHGLTADADLNWEASYQTLARRFRVVAFDQRGHGQGIEPGLTFRLETCADDVAALAGVLGVERLTAVGYSMGGIIAQLLWRRHRPLVEGLVLCATAADFRVSPLEQLAMVSTMSSLAWTRMFPPLFQAGVESVGSLVVGPLDDPVRDWVGSRVRRSSFTTTVAAAVAVAGFDSSGWIGEVDVPTAVVVTTADRVVPPARQLRLAGTIPGAEKFLLADGHAACRQGSLFPRALLAACQSVAERHHPSFTTSSAIPGKRRQVRGPR